MSSTAPCRRRESSLFSRSSFSTRAFESPPRRTAHSSPSESPEDGEVDVDAPRCRLDPRRRWSNLAAPFDLSSSLRRSHSSLLSLSSASARFKALLRLIVSRSNAP